MLTIRPVITRLGFTTLAALLLPQALLAQSPDIPPGGSSPILFDVLRILFDWRQPALCVYEGQFVPCDVLKKMILRDKMIAAGHSKVCRGPRLP